MVNLIDRARVFAAYPSIGALIREFQLLGFDPDEDNLDDEWCDAMLLQEVNLDLKSDMLMLPHETVHTYPQHLANRLALLLKRLGCTQLFLLGHIKADLFGNSEHREPELLRVRSKLKDLIDRASFKECIKLDLSSLAPLLDVFFWLNSMDSELPEYVFWVDEGQRFCFFICRYGNIHWLSWHEQNHLEEKWFQKLGFRVGVDFNQFA